MARLLLIQPYYAQVFADPNNPLLKQLLAERASRLKASGRPHTSSGKPSQRASRPPSRPSSQPGSSRSPAPRQALPGARSAANAAVLRSPVQSAASQYTLPGTAEVPGIRPKNSAAWDLAAAHVRKSMSGQRRGTEAARFRLVNSLATQPEGSRSAGGWVEMPLRALAREEQSQLAKESAGTCHQGRKESVPLHGELRARGAVTKRQAQRRRQVARDVALVRELLW